MGYNFSASCFKSHNAEAHCSCTVQLYENKIQWSIFGLQCFCLTLGARTTPRRQICCVICTSCVLKINCLHMPYLTLGPILILHHCSAHMPKYGTFSFYTTSFSSSIYTRQDDGTVLPFKKLRHGMFQLVGNVMSYHNCL